MNLVLTNPWGLLALLGIPALVLIYFLRRKAQVITVTTLFLLKRTQRESRAGQRFEKFSNSLPFWLQVLAILLLTWILVEPRFGNQRVVQQIAIVVDSSASMQPLRETIADKLADHLKEMKGRADHASYIVLDHNPRRPRIYQGDDVDDLLENFTDWNPTDGALDPSPAIRIARSLVGPGGVVVYLTDHDGATLPLSCLRLSLGEAKANCGFTGVTVEKSGEEFTWSAIVKNYSDSPQTREWVVETLQKERSDPNSISLPPRQFVTIKGRFPPGQDRCVVRLTGDSLPLDDTLPIIINKPRVARISTDGPPPVVSLSEAMVRGFPHLKATTDSAEAEVHLGVEAVPGRPTIIFHNSVNVLEKSSRLLAEEHPLTTGLNFQSLQIGKMEKLAPKNGDTPLVWAGDHPLILLRQDPENDFQNLVFSFPLAESNAARLPAIAILLHRFTEKIAQETLTTHNEMLETSQLLTENFPKSAAQDELSFVNYNLTGEPEVIPLKEGFRLTQRANSTPGFLGINYQDQPLLEAAVQFADTREADLSQASTTTLPDIKGLLTEQQTREDRFWRWFALLLICLLVAAWYFLNPKSKAP